MMTLTETDGQTGEVDNNRSIVQHTRLPDFSTLFLSFTFCLPCASLQREVGQQKRVLMSGPSWRSVPKSKSSGAILQELPSASWGSGTNTGIRWWRYCRTLTPSSMCHSSPTVPHVCCSYSGSGRSELDELQEEVARRARQQEQQKRREAEREAEREAAMGFNPRPSKFMDLDQLQHQGRNKTREG